MQKDNYNWGCHEFTEEWTSWFPGSRLILPITFWTTVDNLYLSLLFCKADLETEETYEML